MKELARTAAMRRLAQTAVLAVVVFSALALSQHQMASSAAAQEQPPPAPTESTEDDGGSERTVLQTLLDGGIIGALIFVLSMVAVGFMVEHALTIRKSVLMPEDLMEHLAQEINMGKIDSAEAACLQPENQSLISEVVLAGLQRFKASEFGFAEYKTAVEEAGEDQTGRLYRKTEVLGLIGSIAPMLGLTGTVLGMIEAFNTISSSGGMARPDELAGGISKALVTTLMGLIVAIPAMVAFSYFRNKIDSIVAEAGKRVEQILMPLGAPPTMKLSKHRRPTIAAMDMTPMIDIVFLLLIFFMTVSQVSEINKVQLSLPVLEGSDDQKPAIITLNIDAAGEMILSGRTVNLGHVIAAVSDELRRLGDDPSRLTFVLRTDERAESRPVNQVISALGRMQVTKVRLAVQTEG